MSYEASQCEHTASVRQFILLALDPVLQSFRFTSCGSNLRLHLLSRHIGRHPDGGTGLLVVFLTGCERRGKLRAARVKGKELPFRCKTFELPQLCVARHSREGWSTLVFRIVAFVMQSMYYVSSIDCHGVMVASPR